MQNLPLISVLIPAYNCEKYVKKCLTSVVNQTYKNLEIIVVDDGSKDNTYSIVEEFAKQDERIKLLQKENEKSVALTRNFLLRHKTGEYFCFVDSDDIISKDYVYTLYNNLIKFDADLSVCSFSIKLNKLPAFFKNKKKTILYQGEDIPSVIVLANKPHFQLWNKLFLSTLADGIEFENGLNYGEDFVYCYKYAKKCKSVVYSKAKLYKYYIHKGSTMNQKALDSKYKFLTALTNLLENENNKKNQEVLKAWIAFTSTYLVYDFKKVIDQQRLVYLSGLIKEYTPFFKNNPHTARLFRIALKYMQSRIKKVIKGK